MAISINFNGVNIFPPRGWGSTVDIRSPRQRARDQYFANFMNSNFAGIMYNNHDCTSNLHFEHQARFGISAPGSDLAYLLHRLGVR